jgi:hypothetical protein
LLPPHITYLLQLLDIGIVQSYKYYYQENLEEAIQYGGADYKKVDFLAGLTKIQKHTSKHGIIKSRLAGPDYGTGTKLDWTDL